MTLDAKQLGSALNQIAYGETMMAAVRDYQKEMLAAERAGPSTSYQDVDVDDLLDDPELEKLHADRLAALKQEAEKRAQLERAGHGTYVEISEGEFLELVTKTDGVVCHFFHKEFERCKIVDKHLAQLARKYMEARFIKLSAPDAPFFTVKLGIKVLPCVVLFRNGVSVDRFVGFDQFGGKDDFSTGALEARLKAAGIVGAERRKGLQLGGGSDSEGEQDERRQQQQQSKIRAGFKAAQDPEDESSDFED